MPCNEITNTDMILLDIFGITNNGLLALTALLTGVALVFLALFLAGLLSPPTNVVSRRAAKVCRSSRSDITCSQFYF